MVNSQESDGQASNVDLLAAVVLDALVRAAPRALSVEQLAELCERDPTSHAARNELARALRGLCYDGLAHGRGTRFAATRAARRADALRF